MNVGDEHSVSYWMESGPEIAAGPLESDLSCDVVVIGAGIAGLSSAYELSSAGRSVVVIDRGRIGKGMTARTTAHLATELDDFYSELIKVRGEYEARLYYRSQVAAIDRIEAVCRAEGIDCGFRRLDGFLIPTEEGPIADLLEEYDSCKAIGVDVEWAERAPIPGLDSGRCLRFPNQGRFHPTRYLAGLAAAIEKKGGRLFADTVYVGDEEKDGGVEISTEGGFTIRAGAAIFATNSPVNNKVQIHPKQAPDRTYVIAGRVAKGSVPDILLWDTYEAYHYVRIEPLSDSEDLLIVGGEDHRSGEANDMAERLARLSDWTRRRYPSYTRADYSWSGQVMEPIDFMPFSGRNPGSDRIYIHTGDSGQGITNGVAGSLAISALILGRDCDFAAVLDPDRKSVTSGASVMEFVRGQAGAIKNLAEHLGPGEIGSVDELEPGEGGIVRRGLAKVAAYRNPEGKLIERSASCTHMGCVVHWNGFERCWDCPCHGSQFAPDGAVLNGPAVKPLAEVEDPA
ncbi:MAG TPA: FAD-dependent oxidoreductase [Allosphingosinicella sp.]|nr:FAD-dependent oxidoreductase [Allosphingosinicella sp.]